MQSWQVMAVAAAIVAGLRGYWLKRTAERIGHPQQVQLVSTSTTVLLGLVLVAYKRPPGPTDPLAFVGLCVAGGIAYVLYGILSSYSQQFLSLSLVQSGLRIGGALPLFFYHYMLNEEIPSSEAIAIVTSAFPLILISFAPDGDREVAAPEQNHRGVVALVGASLAYAGTHVLSKLSVDPSLRVDQILLIVGTNMVAAALGIALIALKHDRAAFSMHVVRSGLLAGLLNVVTFWLYLSALSAGPAAVVTWIYSYHAFLSTATAESLAEKKRIRWVAFLSFFAIVSLWILIQQSVSP